MLRVRRIDNYLLDTIFPSTRASCTNSRIRRRIAEGLLNAYYTMRSSIDLPNRLASWTVFPGHVVRENLSVVLGSPLRSCSKPDTLGLTLNDIVIGFCFSMLSATSAIMLSILEMARSLRHSSGVAMIAFIFIVVLQICFDKGLEMCRYLQPRYRILFYA